MGRMGENDGDAYMNCMTRAPGESGAAVAEAVAVAVVAAASTPPFSAARSDSARDAARAVGAAARPKKAANIAQYAECDRSKNNGAANCTAMTVRARESGSVQMRYLHRLETTSQSAMNASDNCSLAIFHCKVRPLIILFIL